MDTIGKGKKLQAMYSYKTQFLYNLVFHLLLALICSTLCSYPFWFPSLCSSMKQLLFLSLPQKPSSFFSPTCLFIVVNVIVVFLVGESKFGGSNRSPEGEIYDEYIERSRSLRRVSPIQEKADEGKEMELKLTEQRVISASSSCSSAVNEDEEVKEDVKNVIELSKEEDYKEAKEGEGEGEEEAEEEEEEESGLAAEELNRRAEEFIARVNKQRLLEARLLVCCEA